MGKSRTNIFSRRRKESDNVIKENDADKKRRSIDTSNVENVSMSVDAKGEKKKPRDSRKTVGKQKAENNRSLKRMKKRGDGEDIYESRKLLIRQMQGLIAKEVHGSCSEYDSWSDLEENFALAYEPIPLNIHMDTW